MEKFDYDELKKFDGCLSTDGKIETADVLFILREPNSENKQSDVFWFQKVVEAKESNTSEYFDPKNNEDLKKGSQTRYFNFFSILLKKLYGREDVKLSEKAAYMNLNPSGGFSVVNEKIYPGKALSYEDYTRERVKEINPDVIVCCGKSKGVNTFEMFLGLYGSTENIDIMGNENHLEVKGIVFRSSVISLNGKSVHCFEYFHPSAPCDYENVEFIGDLPFEEK